MDRRGFVPSRSLRRNDPELKPGARRICVSSLVTRPEAKGRISAVLALVLGGTAIAVQGGTSPPLIGGPLLLAFVGGRRRAALRHRPAGRRGRRGGSSGLHPPAAPAGRTRRSRRVSVADPGERVASGSADEASLEASEADGELLQLVLVRAGRCPGTLRAIATSTARREASHTPRRGRAIAEARRVVVEPSLAEPDAVGSGLHAPRPGRPYSPGRPSGPARRWRSTSWKAASAVWR